MNCLYPWVVAQIILESFPISSSGHTQLLTQLCSFAGFADHTKTMFEYALHLPTVCIIFIFFRRAWSFPFLHINRCWRLIAKISFLTFVATLITAAGYGLKMLLSITVPLWLGFLITGCCLLSLLLCPEKPYAPLTLKKAVCLGLLQALALYPGLSRFALTFVGARWLGIQGRRAFEISFLIQWPLIFCASIYGIYNLHAWQSELLNPKLMCVMLISGVIAYGGLYMQEYMIHKKIMWRWGVYMLIPCVISILLGVMNA